MYMTLYACCVGLFMQTYGSGIKARMFGQNRSGEGTQCFEKGWRKVNLSDVENSEVVCIDPIEVD